MIESIESLLITTKEMLMDLFNITIQKLNLSSVHDQPKESKGKSKLPYALPDPPNMAHLANGPWKKKVWTLFSLLNM